MLWSCVYRKGNSILEMDDEGGRMFLRVLIHLIMHNYAPLVSGALQLLFRHFSQRQEVLHTFKQVHTNIHTQTRAVTVVAASKTSALIAKMIEWLQPPQHQEIKKLKHYSVARALIHELKCMRLEFTTFWLWDWRAACCANKAAKALSSFVPWTKKASVSNTTETAI